MRVLSWIPHLKDHSHVSEEGLLDVLEGTVKVNLTGSLLNLTDWQSLRGTAQSVATLQLDETSRVAYAGRHDLGNDRWHFDSYACALRQLVVGGKLESHFRELCRLVRGLVDVGEARIEHSVLLSLDDDVLHEVGHRVLTTSLHVHILEWRSGPETDRVPQLFEHHYCLLSDLVVHVHIDEGDLHELVCLLNAVHSKHVRPCVHVAAEIRR